MLIFYDHTNSFQMENPYQFSLHLSDTLYLSRLLTVTLVLILFELFVGWRRCGG